MEVVYCAGCGRRIDAQEIERGEVAKVLQDYYCLKCAQGMGLSLEPTREPRALGARLPTPRPKSLRGPRPAKTRNTTLVLVGLGAVFLAACLCGVYVVRMKLGAGTPAARRTRRVRRTQGQMISTPEAAGRTGTDEGRALFAPQTRPPVEDEPEFLPQAPPPPPAREAQKKRTILLFDFEAGVPEGWEGKLETETLPYGSTKALSANDRGGGLFYAGDTGNDRKYFRAARATRVSFDCRSSHTITLKLELFFESPEEKGKFWKNLEVSAGEWKRLELRVMDLLRGEDGKTVREGAECLSLRFKLFDSPPGLKFVIDNVEVFEPVEEPEVSRKDGHGQNALSTGPVPARTR